MKRKHTLKLYNSLTGRKEVFIPLNNNKVKIYVCGITPYDTTHLGHAFTYVFFDVLTRYLKFKKYDINYTQNVTDIDDDILKKAREENKSWQELGKFWTTRFLLDMKSLNVIKPTNYVLATESISSMVEIISALFKRGFAYKKSGNVYFDIKKFKNYGELSNFNYQQMLLISKERGGDPGDPAKKNPLDFILWQKSGKSEPFWKSPFGNGRPGWHIECSSMVYRYLGEQIDIHGGGRDLVFPHHDSEIAQSQSFTGKKPFVKYWLHTAMLLYNGEKMAKSLGNLVMVRDLLKKYSPNAIRWMLISHNYREPWQYDKNELKKAEKNISIVYKSLNVYVYRKMTNAGYGDECLENFIKSMDDDINTREALALILELAKAILKTKNKKDIYSRQKNLRLFMEILGFSL